MHPHRSATAAGRKHCRNKHLFLGSCGAVPGPVCMWQSLELDYIFMGWMDRQEGWGGTRCLGSEKADLLGISKETVSAHSQTPLAQEM